MSGGFVDRMVRAFCDARDARRARAVHSRPRGGPPRGSRLTVEQVDAMVEDNWPADADAPTLEAIAFLLGKSERWVSETVGGWRSYMERKEADRN